VSEQPLEQALDFGGDEGLSGFRLRRFEVLNWGTFHQHVWRIEPDGRNALLTGDIGSGKSTLVDALTTLLVPHQKITYNKAAGAEGRERSLASYVRGEYKSEQDEATQGARAVALRDDNSYSVLLAWFYNEGFDQGATLAQVFWHKEGQRKPERFFVFAQIPLSIRQDFSDFGSDILDLRKRLRKQQGVEVIDRFKEYAGRFRRLFGIQQEKALDLFYQTVSMKSVGNLTDFVRNHMLERSEVEERIDKLRRDFDNLNSAHEAVLKAKDQITRLKPLVEEGERHDRQLREIETLSACRDALEPWFAEQRGRLTAERIVRLEGELGSTRRRLERLQGEMGELELKADTIKAGIEDSGGSRLRAIDQDIQRLEPLRRDRQAALAKYNGYCETVGLVAARDEDGFENNRQRAQELLAELTPRAEALNERKTDLAVDIRGLKDQGVELERELASLRGRKSNIPRRSLEIRSRMAEDLGVAATALPFVGELLQVAAEEQAWAGAAERLLHGFGLSLLVSEQHYNQVSRYVDRTHLKGRVVYYRTHKKVSRDKARELHPDALCRKLKIKPESPFYDWLETWLESRFDHVCCNEVTDFHRLPKAVTLQGQIKSGGRRHEKDDRHDLHDRSRYILGWSNRDKITALEQSLAGVAAAIADKGRQSQTLSGQIEQLELQRANANYLLNVERFEAIDWEAPGREIAALVQEKQEIEESSDRLKSLRSQLRIVTGAIEAKREKAAEAIGECGKLEERLENLAERQAGAEALAAVWNIQQRESLLPRLQALHGESGGAEFTLHNLDKQQRDLRTHIQKEIDKIEQRRKRCNDRIIKWMQEYKGVYNNETAEVDAAIEALPEYRDMLTALEAEGLPRHEARFRQLLRDEAINGVQLFQARLDREQQAIGDKIDAINNSLREIEYNPGSYIILLKDPAQDAEIRDFRQQLRQLLSGALDEDQLYTEEKFLQVKEIIDRFNGREGMSDLDRRWTRKVTDVRNWFNFSASERWREDDSEREFYSDAAGKSGGQKEKLAYTILASALAYQFGLEWGSVRSRSFRFVVIDEAFGRGSDESTRYALELFRRLNLQLLIVTPLQKIHVIEDYIHAVHFVHNEGGKQSVIRNLTVEEYQREKSDYQAQKQ
jgi:uncharacterized protein YPO0396